MHSSTLWEPGGSKRLQHSQSKAGCSLHGPQKRHLQELKLNKKQCRQNVKKIPQDRLTQCKRCGDTKGHVTAISEKLYGKGQFSKLEKPTKILRGPGGTSIKVKGMFTATLSKNNKNTKEDNYVVEGLSMPLLSRMTAIALQLVARVENISLDFTETIKKEFPKLFSGLGKMEGKCNIVLKPGAQPFSLSTPRRISLPLLTKVKPYSAARCHL